MQVRGVPSTSRGETSVNLWRTVAWFAASSSPKAVMRPPDHSDDVDERNSWTASRASIIVEQRVETLSSICLASSGRSGGAGISRREIE